MLFSVSTGVWERDVEHLNMLACSVINFNYEQYLHFFLSFISVCQEKREKKKKATRASLVIRFLTLAHPSKFEEKQETARSLLNILS